MDDKQRATDADSSGDDHYQPWLRNGGKAGAAQRPAPLPTRATPIIERAEDPVPPMRSAHLTADELLARPIPMTQAAPGPLGLIDRVSQGIADGSAAVRSAWKEGGIGEAVAKMELGRRAAQATRALAKASRGVALATVESARATGDVLGPAFARTGRATGNGLTRVGSAFADGGRKLGAATRDVASAAADAVASRTAKSPPPPASQLDRLIDETPVALPAVPSPGAAPLPLFTAADQETAPAPRRKGKPAQTADSAPSGSTIAPSSVIQPDDRSPMSNGQGRGGSIGTSSDGNGSDRPWLRHPATLALGGAFLVSTGFAAGLYWTGPGVDRATTERVVHDYLLNNPEILPQAMERLQANQAAAAVGRLRSRIETPFSGAWAGSADGDVVLTVFTDYACTFCRASVPDIDRLLREDARLKVVFRELPILSQESEPAARLALAAARRGRYMPMHRALFESRSPDAAARTAAAERLGVAAGSAVLDDAAITRELQSNLALARELGFDGTPSWVVGDRLLTGAVGYEQLRAAVAAARAG